MDQFFRMVCSIITNPSSFHYFSNIYIGSIISITVHLLHRIRYVCLITMMVVCISKAMHYVLILLWCIWYIWRTHWVNRFNKSIRWLLTLTVLPVVRIHGVYTVFHILYYEIRATWYISQLPYFSCFLDAPPSPSKFPFPVKYSGWGHHRLRTFRL